ncbi:hypothetical protein DFH08DRAFT_976804 [Mycena albidolilacea]|uniref:Uncharacterized protein n=1 Tax=Mycena albidolilacea TaxID=1033008 RepID=A0AAD6Z1P8_9AGAR|nr:hypothetical protein DFH08DRAFT_976804 [Mycena albidolilacea]
MPSRRVQQLIELQVESTLFANKACPCTPLARLDSSGVPEKHVLVRGRFVVVFVFRQHSSCHRGIARTPHNATHSIPLLPFASHVSPHTNRAGAGVRLAVPVLVYFGLVSLCVVCVRESVVGGLGDVWIPDPGGLPPLCVYAGMCLASFGMYSSFIYTRSGALLCLRRPGLWYCSVELG